MKQGALCVSAASRRHPQLSSFIQSLAEISRDFSLLPGGIAAVYRTEL